MKRSTLILLAIIFISMNIYSQDDNKGKFQIGGNASVYTSDSENAYTDHTSKNSSQSYNIDVSFGYFISNRFLIGVKPGYNYRTSTSETILNIAPYETESKISFISIGPFIRYYQPIYDRLSFFAEADVTYNFGEETSYISENYFPGSDNNGKLTGIDASLRPGLSYRILDWLYLDASFIRLSYSSSQFKPDEQSEYESEDKRSNFGFYFNSFKFGLSARLGK